MSSRPNLGSEEPEDADAPAVPTSTAEDTGRASPARLWDAKQNRGIGWGVLVVAVVLWLGASGWVVQWARSEHTLYYWDQVGYWAMGIELKEAFQRNAAEAAARVLASIRFDDYNLIGAVPGAVAMSIAGTSRAVLLLANTNAFTLPALGGLVVWLAWLLRREGVALKGWLLAALMGIVLGPVAWAVTFLGLPDVGGIGLLVVALALIEGAEWQPGAWRRWLAAGATLAVLALFRRWYLYAVIGVGATVAVDFGWQFWRDLRDRRAGGAVDVKFVANRIVPLIAFGGGVGVTYLLLAWPLPYRVFKTDYGQLYLAYRTAGSWGASLVQGAGAVVRTYGVLPCGVALVAGVVGGWQGDARRRRLLLYLTLPAALAFGAYSKAQTFGVSLHHFLLVWLPIAALPWLVLGWMMGDGGRTKPWARGVAWGLVLHASMQALLVFSGVEARTFLPGAPLRATFSRLRVIPSVRSDLAQIEAMLALIERVCPGPERGAYVLASNEILSGSHLENAPYSLARPFGGAARVMNEACIDRRDGFPRGLLAARLVLVADPVQTHLAPSEQQVIVAPARMFLGGEAFSRAFRRRPEEFTLEGGVRVFAFERTRPSSTEEIGALRAALPQLRF